MYLFCPDSQAFYPVELQAQYEEAGRWPANGVPVSHVEYRKLQAGIPAGHKIGAGPDGKPAYVPMDAPSPELVASLNRTVLQHRLDAIRPTVNELEDRQSDGLLSDAQREQLATLKAYRRKLLELDISGRVAAWPDLDPALLA